MSCFKLGFNRNFLFNGTLLFNFSSIQVSIQVQVSATRVFPHNRTKRDAYVHSWKLELKLEKKISIETKFQVLHRPEREKLIPAGYSIISFLCRRHFVRSTIFSPKEQYLAFGGYCSALKEIGLKVREKGMSHSAFWKTRNKFPEIQNELPETERTLAPYPHLQLEDSN